MIASDKKDYICRGCVIESLRRLTEKKPLRRRKSTTRKIIYPSEIGAICSFCNRKAEDFRAGMMPEDKKVIICDECLYLCLEIILEKIFGERKPDRVEWDFKRV